MNRFIASQPPPPPPSSDDDHSLSPTILLDTFRLLHPSREKAYTCWSTLLDSRKTNYGTRIDYVLASIQLAEKLVAAGVCQDVLGSDHCPVYAEFDLGLASSGHQIPSLSSSYFSGKQSKLSAFAILKSSASSGQEEREKGAKRTLTQPSSSSIPKAKKQQVSSKQTLLSFSTPRTDPINPSPGSVSPSPAQGHGVQKLSAAWKGVFASPPKVPRCTGHNEPCVMRKVKKEGTNKDKQFWVCARPGGSKGDPLARCDYFKWHDVKNKSDKKQKRK